MGRLRVIHLGDLARMFSLQHGLEESSGRSGRGRSEPFLDLLCSQFLQPLPRHLRGLVYLNPIRTTPPPQLLTKTSYSWGGNMKGDWWGSRK